MVLHHRSTYLLLFAVVALSILTVVLLPGGETLRMLFATPGIGAMFAALYQIARDEARFEKDKELKRIEQTFGVGISSHMASIVFDKHVAFCEAYAEEVDRTVRTLFREGPTDEALQHAGNLYGIRRRYTAWLTNSMSEKLGAFESALRSLGADSGFVRSTTSKGDYADKRSESIERMYKTFSEVMDFDAKTRTPDTDRVEDVLDHIRQLLGTEQLTRLRKKFIEDAIENNADT